MIIRHVTFSVLPGHEHAFESFYATEYRPTMVKAPGLVGVELLRETDQPHRYQMAMKWQGGESAAAWRTSPAHDALRPRLKALHSGTEVVEYVRVA